MINNSLDKKLISLFGVADPEKSRLDREENLRIQDEMLREHYELFEKNSRDKYPQSGFMALVDAYNAKPAPLILYGAGFSLMSTLRQAAYFGLRPDFLCDRDGERAASNPFGLKTITLDELIGSHLGSHLLAVTWELHIYENMRESLISLGFPAGNIYNVW